MEKPRTTPVRAGLYAAVHTAPISALCIGTGTYLWWPGAALLGALALALAGARSRSALRLAQGAAALMAVGNLALAISVYVQGEGFNSKFFIHANAATLAVAWSAYRIEIMCAVLCAIATVTTLRHVAPHERTARTPRSVVVLAVLCALGVYAPGLSLASYALDHARDESAPRLIVAPPQGGPEGTQSKPGKGKSLVMIITESLEATYGRADLLGDDLTPKLSALEATSLRFSDMRQIPEASWTMGALVASQCAVALPIGRAWHVRERIEEMPDDPRNTATGAITQWLPGTRCLGDILTERGYRTTFLEGASLEFAGKGAFLGAHGFSDAHGARTLRARLPEGEHSNGPWGLYDEDLLDLALKDLERLNAGDEPFALVVLTIDTHELHRKMTSPGCGPTPWFDDGKFALGCADRLVADFIAAARRRAPEAIVVAMSDHLAFPNRITKQLTSAGARARRLRFAAWGDDIEPATIDRPGTHFDIAPTVLDLLDIGGWDKFGLGASLLEHDSPWLTHPDSNALKATPALVPIRLAAGETIRFDAEGPTVTMTGQTIRANLQGGRLVDAVFTLRFHDDGSFDMALPWQQLETLKRHEHGSLVVGLSTSKVFNEALGANPLTDTVWFSGRLGTKGGLRFGTLEDRVEIAGPETTIDKSRAQP